MPVSIIETVLIFAVIPLAIYGVFALLTLRPKFARAPKYRPGQEWGYPPVWWSANPAGFSRDAETHGSGADDSSDGAVGAASADRGGASGSW